MPSATIETPFGCRNHVTSSIWYLSNLFISAVQIVNQVDTIKLSCATSGTIRAYPLLPITY